MGVYWFGLFSVFLVTSLSFLCTYDSRFGILIGRRFACPGCVVQIALAETGCQSNTLYSIIHLSICVVLSRDCYLPQTETCTTQNSFRPAWHCISQVFQTLALQGHIKHLCTNPWTVTTLIYKILRKYLRPIHELHHETLSTSSNPIPRPIFRINARFKNASRARPRVCRDHESTPMTPRTSAACNAYNACCRPCSSATRSYNCLPTTVGATRTSSMGGRPAGVSEEGGAVEVDGVDEDGVDVERAFASAIVASARWMDCWRMVVFDWRVPWRVFRVLISFWSVAMAACRECDWEMRDWAAVSDCAAWVRRVSARVCETARSRASFSGLGGIGGAGPAGPKDGNSSSKGEVRRSGVSFFATGAVGGGCW